METFKEKYTQGCLNNNVDPLRILMDKISMKTAQKTALPSTAGDETATGTVQLENSKPSRELDLASQTLQLNMVKALSQALLKDEVFLKLKLADCLIGDDGAIVLCQTLKENKTFEQLDLRGNNIRADGSLALSQLLKLTVNLKWLSLEWNCIGIWDHGIKALADGLSLNQSLEYLDLRNNKISPQGGATLASATKGNTSLKHLDLRWNNLGLLGGRSFLDMLQWNHTVLYIDLQGNDLPDDILTAIDLALERNRSAHSITAEASERARYLSNTIEQLTSENEATISQLKSRLMTRETETMSLNEKLAMISDDAENSRLSTKVLQSKLNEETAKRERAEKKLMECEEVLTKERRQYSDKQQSLMNDLLRERDQFRSFENDYRQRLNKEMEAKLELDAKLKSAELELERTLSRLSKENSSKQPNQEPSDDKLLRENHALHKERKKLWKETQSLKKDLEHLSKENKGLRRERRESTSVSAVSARPTSPIQPIEATGNAEVDLLMQENVYLNKKIKKLSETIEELETQLKQEHAKHTDNDEVTKYRKKLSEEEDEIDTLRRQLKNQKNEVSELQEALNEAHGILRSSKLQSPVPQQDPALDSKYHELNAKYQQLLNDRDQLQALINSKEVQWKQINCTLETKLRLEQDQSITLQRQLQQMTAERRSIEDEISRLRHQWQQRQEEQSSHQERLNSENRTLRTETARLQSIIDRQKDDEVHRAKSLEEAISHYVRVIEKSAI